MLKLQEIEKELTIIGGLPAFHKARTIAVAGGFSAGKSEFISSFFKDKTLKLPSGIKPTTAIPTYVVNEKKQASKKLGNKTSLVGVNQNGAAVDLSEIDPELAKNLNHDFIRSFNFPLKSIMPYMFLSTELKYENICFVDTPGYNPTGSHTTEDMAAAKEFVENSEALIWLVGVDANGTIPRSDIQFLKNILGKSKKPVYFVLNKADARPESDLTKIIQEFSRVLEREHIQYEGISAYNSLEGNGLLYLKAKGKKDLFDFLKNMNKPSNKQDDILRKLYEVEHAYQFALKKDIKQRKAIAEALDNVAFDLNEANFKRGRHRIYDQLETISSYFNTQNEEKHLKTLYQVITNFTNVINQMFGKVSQVRRPDIDIDDIDIEKFGFNESSDFDEIKTGIKESEYEFIKPIHKITDEIKLMQSSLSKISELF
nr:dynamin family protein [uncultured Haemophilus sp.]